MNWVVKLLWFVLGAAACLVVVIASSGKFDPEFKLTDALNLLVAIAIALLIQHYATERHSDIRAAKNLLISRVEDVSRIVTEAHKTFWEAYASGVISEPHLHTIITSKSAFNNSIFVLEQGCVRCRLRSQFLDEILNLRRHYCEALTGQEFPRVPYSAEMMHNEDRHYRQLSDAFQSLIFDIN